MTLHGKTVHYQQSGSGPFLFLLHGWAANLGLFAGLQQALSRSYTVISVDFPGCGGTPEPEHPLTMADYVDFTKSFINSFTSDSAIILGHSHGGRVAICLASDADWGFDIPKLILVDSGGILPLRGLGYHLRVRAFKLGRALLSSGPVHRVFPEALLALQQNMGSTDYRSASPVMRATMVNVVNADLRSKLTQIRADTLLIWGDQDQATPLRDAHIMEDAIASAGLVVLPDAGHFSFLDQAFTFTKVVESFLGMD
ncbi:MAG: alpha/beta hydrolase [Propionibacteriaceae bacterium]|nr:alpha/beta hydrolase [Propionibacteriaceae bacterium]